MHIHEPVDRIIALLPEPARGEGTLLVTQVRSALEVLIVLSLIGKLPEYAQVRLEQTINAIGTTAHDLTAFLPTAQTPS